MKRSLIRIAVFVPVTLLCLASPFLVWRGWWAYKVHRQLAAIRAAGLPATGEELNRWYAAVLDDQNAARVMQQAFALLHDFPEQEEYSRYLEWETRMDRRQKWTQERRECLTKLVAMNAEALAKAGEAVKLPRCRYPVDFSAGVDTDLPHLAGLKGLGLKASYRAALAADEGRSIDCKNDIVLIIRLARTLDGEPGVASQATRRSILDMAVTALQRCLNATALDEGLCRELDREFAEATKTNLAFIAFVGYQAQIVSGYHADGRVWLLGVHEPNLAFYLSAMETNLNLVKVDPPAGLVVCGAISNQVEAASAKNLWAGSHLYVCRNVVFNFALTSSYVRLARVALAAENFRIQNGCLPADLGALGARLSPAERIDPFDGKPVRYQLLTNGFKLYGVSYDMEDQGGAERPLSAGMTFEEWRKLRDVGGYEIPTGTNWPKYDMVFAVER